MLTVVFDDDTDGFKDAFLNYAIDILEDLGFDGAIKIYNDFMEDNK